MKIRRAHPGRHCEHRVVWNSPAYLGKPQISDFISQMSHASSPMAVLYVVMKQRPSRSLINRYEVSGSNPRLGGLWVSPFQASGGAPDRAIPSGPQKTRPSQQQAQSLTDRHAS